MRDITEVLSFNMKRLRKKKDWTQADLCEAMRVSFGTVQAYEARRRWPELEFLKAMAKALSVNVTDLLKDPDDIPTLELPEEQRRGVVESFRQILDQSFEKFNEAGETAVTLKKSPALLKLFQVALKLKDSQIDILRGQAEAILERVFDQSALKKKTR